MLRSPSTSGRSRFVGVSRFPWPMIAFRTYCITSARSSTATLDRMLEAVSTRTDIAGWSSSSGSSIVTTVGMSRLHTGGGFRFFMSANMGLASVGGVVSSNCTRLRSFRNQSSHVMSLSDFTLPRYPPSTNRSKPESALCSRMNVTPAASSVFDITQGTVPSEPPVTHQHRLSPTGAPSHTSSASAMMPREEGRCRKHYMGQTASVHDQHGWLLTQCETQAACYSIRVRSQRESVIDA